MRGLYSRETSTKKGGIRRGVKDRQSEEARKLGHEVKHEVGDQCTLDQSGDS